MAVSTEQCNVEDNLQIKLVDGNTGKTVFDSEKNNKPVLGFPDKPLKFCTDCGREVVAIIYMCKGCGQRYIQTEDKKTGRIMTVAIPAGSETEQV